MVHAHSITLGILVILLGDGIVGLAAEEKPSSQAAASPVEFERDVAPILREQCLECHGPTMQMADLRLDEKRLAFESGESGGSIQPGSSESSYFIQRLHDRDEGILMPPTGRLSENEIKILRDWIDQGATWPDDIVLARPSDAETALPDFHNLFEAIRRADTEAVRELLDAHPMLIKMADRHDSTPLMYAALYANADCVKLLLDRGADANRADEHGATPLMWAAGDAQKVRVLLDHGARVDSQSKFGKTTLAIAAAYAGNLETVEMLLSAGATDAGSEDSSRSALLAAVSTGDLAMVQRLIEAQTEASKKLEDGKHPTSSALVAAAFLNEMPIVKYCLDGGVNQSSLDGALTEAALNGSREMVELLLDAGADATSISKRQNQPATALIAAAYTDYQDNRLLQLLIRHGADPSVRDAHDRSAFDYAVRHARTHATDLFLQPRKRTAVSTQEAAAKSVRLLQSCGTTFFRKSGCVACHQHSTTSIALEQARRKGVRVDEAAAKEQLNIAALVQGGRRPRFLQRITTGGAGHTVGYLLIGMAAENYPADETTDASAIELSGLQMADGSWFSHSHRPPTEYSRISATAVSVHAMQLYAPPGLKEKFTRQATKTLDWLLQAKPTSNQEFAFRLLGLKWTHADSKDIQSGTDALLAQQQRDGGWRQLPGMQTDAYATGLALYALHVGGAVSPQDSAYRRGVQFLLSSQLDDGSWHVRSRSFKFQPYFESGFPHHHDQWISSAATGWAATALMMSLDES